MINTLFVKYHVVVMAIWLSLNTLWVIELVQDKVLVNTNYKLLTVSIWLVMVAIGLFPIVAGWLSIIVIILQLLDIIYAYYVNKN